MLERARVERARILVAGDAMLDRYWFGSVERISPEAPVPIVSVREIEERAGGAANVAMNVASIGAQCALVSVVGDDEAGDSLQFLLGESPIDTSLVVDRAGRTVTKLRMVAQNQQLMRADFDGRPGEEALGQYMELYESALDAADVVILSDYGKGGLLRIEKMIAAANARSTPVLVDPKGSDFARYSNATIITPNLREFETVAGKVDDDEDLRRKAIDVIRELNIHGLLITRSEKGMVLVEKAEQWFDYPPSAREVYDVSGAGDTVVAAFAIGYALSLPYEEAVRLANTAAGVVVGKFGTATATLDEINAVIAQQARGSQQVPLTPGEG